MLVLTGAGEKRFGCLVQYVMPCKAQSGQSEVRPNRKQGIFMLNDDEQGQEVQPKWWSQDIRGQLSGTKLYLGLAQPMKTSATYRILCFLKSPSSIWKGNYLKTTLIRVTFGEKCMEECGLSMFVYHFGATLIKCVNLKRAFCVFFMLYGNYLDIKPIHITV